MKINEIFKSIQGEGKYTGHPVLFIRTSGCTRQCSFCDTQYHKNGKEMTPKQIAKAIKKSGMDTVVWTGGEPMMWESEIYEVINELVCDIITMGHIPYHCLHHLETNGDILPQSPNYFDYIGFSPKEKKVQDNVLAFGCQLDAEQTDWDIKIVTDLKMNKDMIEHATMLMPLSTYTDKDQKIQQDVWEYCVKHNLKYAHRIHVSVWGQAIGK